MAYTGLTGMGAGAAAGTVIPAAEIPPEVSEFITLVRLKRPNPGKGIFGTLGRNVFKTVRNNTLRAGRNLKKELGIAGIMGRYYRIHIKKSYYSSLFDTIDTYINHIANILEMLLYSAHVPSMDQYVKNHFELSIEALARYREDPKMVDELTQLIAFLREFYQVNAMKLRELRAATVAARRAATAAPAPATATLVAAPAAAAAPAPAPAVPNLGRQAYRSLGAGTYGIVFDPAFPNVDESGVIQEFPQNTVKVFYSPEHQSNAITQYGHLADLMGPNTGHRYHTYRHRYHGRNLSANIRAQIPISQRPGNNSVLPLLRMPHLGVNLNDVQRNKNAVKAELYQVPLIDLLVQIHKVVGQVARLVQRSYVHGDIRSYNIMIHPTTGAITLIDFDFLRPVNEAKALYFAREMITFYNKPPECLVYKKLHTTPSLQTTPPDTVTFENIGTLMDIRSIGSYVTFLKNDYSAYYLNKTNPAIMTEIKDANVDNAKKFLTNYAATETKFFQTFDSYALGLSLLNLLVNLIPEVLTHSDVNNVAGIVAALGSFTNRGTAYTPEHLNFYAAAIHEIIKSLKKMTATLIKRRLNASEIFADVTVALRTLFAQLGQEVPASFTEFTAAVDAGGVVSSPALTAAPAAAAPIVATAPPPSPTVEAYVPPPLQTEAYAPLTVAGPVRTPNAMPTPPGFVNVPLGSTRRRKTRKRSQRS